MVIMPMGAKDPLQLASRPLFKLGNDLVTLVKAASIKSNQVLSFRVLKDIAYVIRLITIEVEVGKEGVMVCCVLRRDVLEHFLLYEIDLSVVIILRRGLRNVGKQTSSSEPVAL
jgi:hypothetical protein